MKKVRNLTRFLLLCLAMCFVVNTSAMAATEQTLANSPYVKFASDGIAWTTCEGDIHNYDYANGRTVVTGIASTLRSLQTGEHYYSYDRYGSIPVGEWVVEWDNSLCIHDAYPAEDDPYHGISYGRSNCFDSYTQGWIAYCADCKEPVKYGYIYACENAILSIDYIDTDTAYYYLCPHCDNLEQGYGIDYHTCKLISWNQYKVKYNANAPYGYYGGMEDSFHMYNNATTYDGEPVTPITHLYKNQYWIPGYTFIGWNTKPDGSGTWYEDEEEIYNLTPYDYHFDPVRGVVTLYAQWKLNRSTLNIDPAGGTYLGDSGITSVTQNFGASYTIDPDDVVPPEGAVVSFESNGGTAFADRICDKEFVEWIKEPPFTGALVDNVYKFRSDDGKTDLLRAKYKGSTIILPTPVKANTSFAGWYYDAAFREYCGYGGDEVSFEEDTTLYARWAPLTLWSKDNYAVNGGKGAVDLWWRQNDDLEKTYLIYQSLDMVDWHRIGFDRSEVEPIEINFVTADSGETFEVESTGWYTLTATGGAGGDYTASGTAISGGNGGKVGATYWLKKGDVITAYAGTAADGSQGGTNGNGADGGSSTDEDFMGGGAASEIYITRDGTTTLLLSAGGGGGANSVNPGGHGGEAVSDSATREGVSSEYGGAGGGYNGGIIVNEGIADSDEFITVPFDYTGTVQEFVVPYDDEYILKVWGAQGGTGWGNGASVPGGKGGYSTGTVELKTGDTIYVVVGGQGGGKGSKYGGYNGGGNGAYPGGGSVVDTAAGGGGATHIGTFNSTLAEHGSTDGLFIVAGGGGGGTGCMHETGNGKFHSTAQGGAGGGLTGGDGISKDGARPGKGGTQTAGGARGEGTIWEEDDEGDEYYYRLYATAGTFGKGGNGNYTHNNGYERGAGGGGGLYGGGGSYEASGAGGSGYIGGVDDGYMETGVWGNEWTLTENTPPDNTAHGYAEIIYPDRTITKSATGGTSYICPDFRCKDSFSEVGVNDGDGEITLTASDFGYYENTNLDGVPAPDLAAPDAVQTEGINPRTGEPAVAMEAVSGESIIRVKWTEPLDNGTPYYHQVESYYLETGGKIAVSNITENTLTSGIKGYYYVVNTKTSTTVTHANGTYITERQADVSLNGTVKYLHIAPVDVAGNLGPTSTIRVSNDSPVNWPLYTRQIYMFTTEGVPPQGAVPADGIYAAAADKTYYVRCDDATPFQLEFGAYMNGKASAEYQINHTIFESQMTGYESARSITVTPMHGIQSGSILTDAGGLSQFVEGTPALKSYSYVKTTRSNSNKNIFTEKQFLLGPEADTKKIRVTPVAAVESDAVSKYSDYSADLNNSIYLIGDCTAPAIGGMDELRMLHLVDKDLDSNVTINLTATDTGSGVSEFYVILTNHDNHITETIYSEDNATLSFDVIVNKAVLNGDVTVEVHAIDNVGNERVDSHDFTEFTLTVSVKRMLAPHDPIFKGGETGILSIRTTGYVDSLDIDFPDILDGYDCVIDYPSPHYVKDEEIEFVLPLRVVNNGLYSITVTAYKNGTSLDSRPKIGTLDIGGTILDEFRVRVR